jgi:hypothetical protein
MRLFIDSSDYTSHVDASARPRVVRRLNAPWKMTAALVAADPSFVVPTAEARVVLERNDGTRVFTGYLDAVPEWEHLGWNERGPVYRYKLWATSDEIALERKRLPARAPMVNRTAGSALKQLAEDAGGALLDVSGVQALDVLPQVSTSIQRTFSDQAAEIATRARAVCRVHDGKVVLEPVGVRTHTLSDADVDFDPAGLVVERPQRIANDVTVIGRIEPRAYVKSYFLGDGVTLGFDLSHTPFTRRNRTIVDEEFGDAALDATFWTKADPLSVVSVSGGKLRVNGGTGADGGAIVNFVEPFEMGGALILQHGELELTGTMDAVIGGLYSGGVTRANCVAGFSGQSGVLRAIVSGALTGPSIALNATHKYTCTTRVYSLTQYRANETFHSSVGAHGGGTVAASVRVVLEVHDVDPANPATLQAQSTILFDGVIASAPAYCTYALANAATMNGSLSFARLLRAVSTEVRTTAPSAATRTRLIGSVAEGAECILLGNQVTFFPAYAPVANEAIAVRYRAAGRAVARVQDATSVAGVGQRSRVVQVLSPPCKTQLDCENAAAAILDDSVLPAVAGKYECWSDFLPGDPLPGDRVTCTGTFGSGEGFFREVEIEAVDLDDDRCRYSLAFANDAMAPLGFEFQKGKLGFEVEAVSPGASYIVDVPNAEITAVTSTTCSIDCGQAAPSGGGFEVRRSDVNFGAANDRNLVGRFATQTFSVPRLTRVQTYYVRAYDASGEYSRYSTVLHVDYPF